MYPTDRHYTKDHEWVRFDDADAAVGITDFAQQQLGDVVFVELPEVGQQITRGEVFGTIESVKAVSELFAPISGEVTATNPDLGASPEQVNSAPHDTWMIRVRPSADEDRNTLLDAEAYSRLTE